MTLVKWIAAVCSMLIVTVWASAQAPDLDKMDLVLRSMPDGPIAKVNGVNISRDEFIKVYEGNLNGLAARQRTQTVDDRTRIQTGVATARFLVQFELLHQEALKRKIAVTDEEVEKEWKGTLDDFKKGLARIQEASGKKDSEVELSEDEILKKASLTREEAMANLRRKMLVNKMSEQLVKEQKIDVSDDEVSKYFAEHKDSDKIPEQVHLQRIFLNKYPGKAPAEQKKTEQARDRIDKALQRIKAGESFEGVAKAVSEAPDKEKGGDLGTVPTVALPPPIQNVISSMKPGDISGVVETDQGFNVLKVVEVVPGGEPSFEKVGPRIRRMLLAQKGEKAVLDFCKPFWEKPGCIEVYLQLQKTIAARPDLKDMLSAGEGPEPSAPDEAKGSSETKASDASKPAETKPKPKAKPKAKAKKPVKKQQDSQ